MHKNNKTISRQLKSAFAAWAAGLYIIGTGATAYALPEGGQVAAGQAAITTAGSTMTIAQQTAQAIINWQNFGIGSGEAVHINQPNSQSMLLNRVVGSNPSEIFGQLTANGQVILVNPNGVFFRPGSSVDVGGLTASTLNIANEDFLKGQLRFAGDSQNPVINAGNITAQNGYVNLLAKEVVNEGIIAAQTGSVNLAAGSGMSLDYNGDGKMTVAVTDGAYQSAVANKKLIQADGGLVVMTASGKDALMDSAVNNSGMIQANTLGEATGQISLTGDNITIEEGIAADKVTISANTIEQAKGVTGKPIKELELKQINENKGIYIGATSSNSTGAESMADASLFASGGVFSQVENLKLNAGEYQDIHLQDVDFQNANITASQRYTNRRQTLNIAGNVSTKGSLKVKTNKFNVAANATLKSYGLDLNYSSLNIIRAGSNAKIISGNKEAFKYRRSHIDIVNSTDLTQSNSINYDFLNALEGFSDYEVGVNDFLEMYEGQLNKSVTFNGYVILIEGKLGIASPNNEDTTINARSGINIIDGGIQMQRKGTLNLITDGEIELSDTKLDMGEGNLNMVAQNLKVFGNSQVSGTGNLYLNTAVTNGSQPIILGSTGGNDYTLYIKPEYFRSGGLFSNLTGRVYIGLLPDDTITKAPIHLTSGTNINNELYLATQYDIQGDPGSSLNTNGNNLYLISQGGNIDLAETALYNTPIKQAVAKDTVKLINSRNELGSITHVSGPNGVEIYSKGRIYTGRTSDSGITATNGTITITSGSSYVELDTSANFLANKVFIFAQDPNNGAFKNYADNPFRLNTKWGIATYDALKDNYGKLTGNFRRYGKFLRDDLEPLMDEKGNGAIHVNQPTVKIVSERVYGSDKQDWLAQAGGNSPNLKTYILNDQGEIDTELTQKYLQADNKFLNKSNTFLLEGVDNKDNYKFGESTNYVNKNIGGTGRNGTAYSSVNPDVHQQVKFNKASDQNYKVQTEFWVTPAQLEVRTEDLNITYNGLNYATTEHKDQLMFNGLVNNDSINKDDIYSFDLDYIKADGQSNKGPLHAGTYGIKYDNLKLQSGNNTLDNYIITYKDGTLIVNPKEVKVALASPNISKTYDGQSSVSQNDFTYTGFVQGESLAAGNVLNFAGTNDLAITQDGQPANGIDVGSYQVKIGNIGVTATDYTFVADDTSSATLEITPHLVTLKANDDSIVKNDNPYKAGTKGFSYLTGFVGNDTAESLGLSTSDLNFGNKAGTTDGADGATLEGKYNIYLDGKWSSKNYKFAYEPGQLIININNPTPPVEALESMQAVQSNTSNNAITANMPNTTGDMPNATGDSTTAPALPGNLSQSAGETTKLEGLPVFIDNNLIQAKDFDTIFAHEELGTFLIQIRDGQMSISPLNQKAVEVLASADPAIHQQLEESIEEHLKDTQS